MHLVQLLAALATWSWRDRWAVQVTLAALLLWWQPLDLHLPLRLVIAIKVAGLVAVGFSIVQRALERTPEGASVSLSGLWQLLLSRAGKQLPAA